MVARMRKSAKEPSGHGEALQALLSPALFKALSDPSRVGILCQLFSARGQPRTVGELAGGCPVDLSVVSRHLRVLKDAGLVVTERRGREVLCRVDASTVVWGLRRIADAIEACCGESQSGAER